MAPFRVLFAAALAAVLAAGGPIAAPAAPKKDCCGKSCPAPKGAGRDCCRVAPARDEAATPRLNAPLALAPVRVLAAPVFQAQAPAPAQAADVLNILCRHPSGLSPPAFPA